jgi:hypothetical protein
LGVVLDVADESELSAELFDDVVDDDDDELLDE